MSKVIYYGKKTKYCGKTAFEILTRLKNFGIGRVLQRNMFKEEFPDQPTYYQVNTLISLMWMNLLPSN